jgi:ribA/ribD-fused uncharacterized protein
MKVGVIPEFKGEYLWLSNFDTAPFEWRMRYYASGEHAFQAAKGICAVSREEADRHGEAIKSATSPAKAKYAGRSVKINLDEWEKNKVQWMREIIHAKFSGVPGYAGKLINTGACMLVEGNDWNDTFWGRCNGKGFNTLGVILMEERGYWLNGDLK